MLDFGWTAAGTEIRLLREMLNVGDLVTDL
jgi:hypothetical protein